MRYYKDQAGGFYYHNMLVSPGVTPIDSQNPGVATFEIDQTTLAPQNLQITFLSLDKTFGWTSIPSDITLIPFRQVSFSQFGMYTLTAEALKDFKDKLTADNFLTLQFLAAKIGFNPADSSEFGKAIGLYQADNIVSDTKQRTYKYVCQMHFNKDANELEECIADNKLLASSATEAIGTAVTFLQ